MPCAPGLTWRHSWLTCVTDAFKETTDCKEQPIAALLEEPTTTTAAPVCPLEAVADKPGYFLNYGIEQYCGDYMIFDAVVCTCLPSGEGPVCDLDMLLYFPFDDDLHDHSCMKASSTQTSEESVTLEEDPERGTVAYFPGAASLHVGFLYNWFADKTVESWSVAVWVKRTGDSAGLAGIINNGDCIGSPSFDIHMGPTEVSSISVDTDGVSQMAEISDVQVAQDKWEHVAMVYDGSSLKMYLNAQEVSSIGVSGAIENTQCATNIGAQHAGYDYFEGYMDEIYIYERAITPEDITTLYSN